MPNDTMDRFDADSLCPCFPIDYYLPRSYLWKTCSLNVGCVFHLQKGNLMSNIYMQSLSLVTPATIVRLGCFCIMLDVLSWTSQLWCWIYFLPKAWAWTCPQVNWFCLKVTAKNWLIIKSYTKLLNIDSVADTNFVEMYAKGDQAELDLWLWVWIVLSCKTQSWIIWYYDILHFSWDCQPISYLLWIDSGYG